MLYERNMIQSVSARNCRKEARSQAEKRSLRRLTLKKKEFIGYVITY